MRQSGHPAPAPTATPEPTPTTAPTATPATGGRGGLLPVNPSGTPALSGAQPSDAPPAPTATGQGAVQANSDGSCPDDHPLKAMQVDKLYHLKDDAPYARARAEECFASEADAQAAGYQHAPR